MLVVLLGAGTGLENNIAWQFRDDAVNSIWLYPGETSKPWKGRGTGRAIQFTDADVERLRRVPGVEHLTGRFYLWGDYTIRYRDRTSAFSVRSCHPDHKYIENTEVVEGRFLNDRDLAERRKVTVIGQKVAEFLFRGAPALGQEIDINGIYYVVIGVFEDVGGDSEMRQVYIPITTAQAAYNGANTVHQIMFTVGQATTEESVVLAERVKQIMADLHGFDPTDPSALRVRNNLESYQQVADIFAWIRAFIWIVGVGTVTAGVVGVGNVMLISVKERTRELGVRKALGATPGSLIALVLREAITLTAVSGYVGLVAGVALVEGVRTVLPENDYIRDPEVQLGAAVAATALLVVCGALAGFWPAQRAARVDPIVALRDGA
ncbi:MAG: ABC transporter permease [Alphaproteobacteria bacterium]|nr:ABC transporter permease [Alphaproteobacteria bacterium]